MTTGEFLAQLRKEKGLTQQAVADALNLTNKTISKWERNEGMPDVHTLVDIADLFGVTVDEILRGERTYSTQNKIKYEELVLEKLKHDKWIIMTMLILGVILFAGVYFTFRKFMMAFSLQLGFFSISLLYMNISLSKARRNQVDSSYIRLIMAQEIKMMILLIVLVLPCGFNQYKGIEVYFTLSQYLKILPYILSVLLVLYLIMEILTNWHKGNIRNKALKCLVILMLMLGGSYSVAYHSLYDKVVYKDKNAYDDFVANYYFIYHNLSNLYSASFPKLEKEAKNIDPSYVDNHLHRTESREKYFGVMGFDSKNQTVRYIRSEAERETIQNIFKVVCLVSDGVILAIYLRRSRKENQI